MTVASDSRPPTLMTDLQGYLRDLIDRVGGLRVFRVLVLVLLGTVSESVGLLLLIPLLHLMNGDASAPALQWLLQQGVRPGLALVLCLFVAAMLLRAWLARRRDMELLAMRLAYVDSLRGELEAALAMASWPFLGQLRHAEVMHLLFDQLGRVNLGTHQMMQAISGVGLGMASLVVIALVAPAWTFALVLPFAGLVWLLRRRLASAAAMGSRFGLGQRELMSAARDFLAGLKLVKAHAVEGQHLSDLARRSAALQEDQLRFARHQASTRSWFEVGGALVLAVLLWVATEWGRMALPELLLLVFVFSRLLPVLRDGQLQLQQLAHMLPALHDVQGWTKRCQAAAEPPVEPSIQRSSLRQSLRFEGVSLQHGGEGPAALISVNLALQAGTTTALMGSSGSGKTTLADLALGLLTPTTGAVWVDGMELASDQARRSWRSAVAYVAQDTYLFPGTIRENLCWLAGSCSQAELWAALESADAADFVQALPRQLDHEVGERGEGLSGGQRQRLALARALLCKPQLLVLDEVTSQLDAESEERVLCALGQLRGTMTILAIAHRAAASRHADRTIVLERGRVISDSAARS